jgi:molybdenum cofactor biosynthesis enzyme MoaA
MADTLKTNGPIQEQLLKEREAAKILDISHRTLQKLRVTGGGPVFCKIAGAVRYRRADLEAFVAASRRASTSAKRPPEVRS